MAPEDTDPASFEEAKAAVNGLSEEEAAARLAKNGYNEIVEKKESNTLKFLKKFYGPVPLMLEAVIIITYLLKDFNDMYIILVLLVFNAVVSFWEEYKADNSLELLKQRITVNARVLRSGKWVVKPSRELVVGDVIRIRLGDIIPADASIISESDLRIDQSVLTGESKPVSKNNGDTVYSGSIVTEGEALCEVTSTAMNTYYGHTVKLVQEAKTKSHLEKTIMNIVKYLIEMDFAIILLIIFFGLFVIKISMRDVLPFALTLLIASVPVALPAAFTVAMALGTEKLSKKSILVTNLNSIEEAASLNIICFDKTGTITENKLKVADVFVLDNYKKEEVVEAAMLASKIEDNDPIDTSIINYAAEIGVNSNAKLIKFTPFQPKTKMSSSIVSEGSIQYEVAKGALSKILELCTVNDLDKQLLENTVENFSKNMYRTIAVAKQFGSDFKLLGVIALYDKPRPDAKELISELHMLGVRTKMLTGDNLAIAKEIAKEVGIGDNIIDAKAFKESSTSELNDMIESADGFANIFPEDKYTIVKALQAKGYRVGMTGDGVNDAPSLKQAEVGIAVSNATDVAKSVAGILLTKDGIDVLVNAIKESRRIFERMMTYTIAKIGKIMQIVFFLTAMLLIFDKFAISAFDLILLIFTNDIVNIAISTDNANYSQKPDAWNVRNIIVVSIFFGLLLFAFSFVALPIAKAAALSVLGMQTLVFLMFDITDKEYIFAIREKLHMWKSRPSRWLVISSAIGIGFGALISYFGIMVAPIGLWPIALISLLSLVFILAFDYVKIFTYKFLNIR
ncbi:MAG: plasma-membrane proton-efflux P-type ATPase [Candidatus Micrarchaeia archaeon]